MMMVEAKMMCDTRIYHLGWQSQLLLLLLKGHELYADDSNNKLNLNELWKI